MPANDSTRYDYYEVLNFQLTDQYVGAFWDADTDSLTTEPLEAIGVAKLERYYPGETEHDAERVIVGLLRDKEQGDWLVANEATNFVGIFKPGEDLSAVKVPARVRRAMENTK